MVEDVAVKDEIADVIPAEVDAQRDTGIRVGGVAIPVRNFDHVQKLPGDRRRLLVTIDLKVVL